MKDMTRKHWGGIYNREQETVNGKENIPYRWAHDGKGWLFAGYPIARKLLQQSKLKNVLSATTCILEKVINSVCL